MKKKDFLPIILGSDENAYGTARLFREAYPEVTPLLVCTAQLIPTRHSRLFDCRIIAGFEREEVFPDALLGVLRECSKDYEKLLVIPCSDYYTGLLCRHYDHFEGLIANRFIPEQLLETFDTKDRFYALCEQYGLDYPKTVIAAPDERIEVADRLPFDSPIVVKPENSNALDYLRCHFEGQKKVFFFDTKEEYLSMVRSMNGSDYRGKLILQEFIPGGDDAMRVLNSYSDTDGTVRAMCLGQPVLEYYDPKSVGNYAAILSRGDTLLYDKMQRFLQAIGYVGFSNIDMKYDSRTGRYVLFEINPRLGRSSFFCRAAGINMMKLLTEDVVYGRRGKCIYNETTALWSNVPRGILTRYVTSPALREEMKQYKALHTLWCGGDLAPARVYRLARYYAAQYKNFAHYYFDKSKEKSRRSAGTEPALFLFHNVVKLPQIADLVVHAQTLRLRRFLRIEPAARKPVVVRTLNVARERIADDQTIFPRNAVDVGEHIVKVFHGRLRRTRGLGDERLLNVGRECRPPQPPALDGFDRVGDEMDMVCFAQLGNDLRGMWHKIGRIAQARQMDAVARCRLKAADALGGKEGAKALEHRFVLRQLPAVEPFPCRVVDDLVAVEKLLRKGQTEGVAHGAEGVDIGLVEVKERVVGVEEQIGITCHRRVSFDFLP